MCESCALLKSTIIHSKHKTWRINYSHKQHLLIITSCPERPSSHVICVCVSLCICSFVCLFSKTAYELLDKLEQNSKIYPLNMQYSVCTILHTTEFKEYIILDPKPNSLPRVMWLFEVCFHTHFS